MPYDGASPAIAILSAARPLPILSSLELLGCDLRVVAPEEAPTLDGRALAAAVVDGEGLDEIAAIRALRVLLAEAQTPILLVSAGDPDAVLRAALEAGARDVVARDAVPLELRMRVANLVELGLARREAEQAGREVRLRLRQFALDARERERETIHRLMLAAECRDEQAADHLTRVAGCTIAIAEGLGLSEEEADDIALASTMHDIGKISVPDRVLLKAGPLTPEEQEEIRQHTVQGHRMLHGSASHLLQRAAEIALSHHERWDGKGYPQGLSGEAIPLAGRIVAVADVFDALVSERAYKKGWPFEKARAHLVAGSGTHFDPACVAAFLSRWDDIVLLMRERPSTYRAA